MAELEWEQFYLDICANLKRDYPYKYKDLFPDGTSP